MLIEFCGMPGSGKTTLINALAKRLRKNGKSVALARRIPFKFIAGDVDPWHLEDKEDWRPLYRLVEFRRAYPDFFNELMDLFPPEQSVQEFLFLLTATFYQNMKVLEDNAAQTHSDVKMMDEGMIQRCAALFMDVYTEQSMDFDRLGQLVLSGPKPDLLVQLNTTPKVALERAIARHEKATEKFRQEVTQKYGDVAGFERRNKLISFCAEQLETSGTSVLMVNSEGSVETNADEIFVAVQRHFENNCNIQNSLS